MKKALIGIGMLALACVVCGPAFAGDVPHQPVTSCPNGSTPLMTAYGADATATVAGSLAIFALVDYANQTDYDLPVTSWPVAGNWDFCAAFDTTACSLGALTSFSSDILTYQSLFFCSTDINGPVNTSGSGLPVTANGIPDGDFELGLLAAIMNDTANPNNAAVVNAFKGNFEFFKVLVTTALANVPVKADLRGLVPSLAPYLASGLTTILAGYATEGDLDTVAALDALINELGAIGVTPPAGGVAGNTTGYPAILSPNGDADGDGFTNKQEYNVYKALGAAATIAAQLDGTPACLPLVIPAVVTLGGTGTYEEGATLELIASAPNGMDVVGYEWFKDGIPLGITTPKLVINILAPTHSGRYSCKIYTTDPCYPVIVSRPIYVTVVPLGTLPLTGGLGLALLAGACALGGVGGIRRRR
jgi:hypothetical protein